MVHSSELPESDDFKKPAPPRRAMTIHEMRSGLSAREKYLVTSKPLEEAVQLVQDVLGADEDSALAYIEFLKGGGPDEPATHGALERIHVTTDPETGIDERVETEPGSIPPRPV